MLVSYAFTLGGLALLLLPTWVGFRLARRRWPRHRCAIAGALFGLTVLPLSLFLYLQFFTDPVRMLLLGLPGWILLGIHLGPFANVAAMSNDIVVRWLPGMASAFGPLPLLGMVVWAGIYGAIGALVDRNRRRTSAPAAEEHSGIAAPGA